MLKFLSDVREIADSVAFVFGTLLAVLVVYGISEPQTLFAIFILSAMAIHGLATIIAWIIRRRAVSER